MTKMESDVRKATVFLFCLNIYLGLISVNLGAKEKNEDEKSVRAYEDATPSSLKTWPQLAKRAEPVDGKSTPPSIHKERRLAEGAEPVDDQATPRTRQLLSLLHTLSRARKVLFGQQGATWCGVHGGHAPYRLSSHGAKLEAWKFTQEMAVSGQEASLCDVCSLVHDFPAVVGLDLSILHKNQTEVLTALAGDAAARGALVTVSWHLANPNTGGPFYVKDDHRGVFHSVRRVLPGGDNHHLLLSALDVIADWLMSLRDKQGREIPIIFRPWHEAGGDWFWWGLGNNARNSETDIVKLYQTTVRYLRDSRRVHSLLYAWAPNCNYNWTTNALYPGDDYVDIIGIDCYRKENQEDAAIASAVHSAVTHARQAGKAAAWTEFGLAAGSDWKHNRHFFTQDALANLPAAGGVAYMMTWQNSCSAQGSCTVFAPHPGHVAAQDFRRFQNDSRILLLSGLRRYAAWFTDH